ncbi:murein hydrolase activator EnvC family protein [endosymbiont of Lamellibrachia barhami]|uniref:murein hydrolase activator EnvC family protein n=1 Tax=endosymbiont of Lamellibrachia barhami TaxID=205975 RepID=UPI0034E2C673
MIQRAGAAATLLALVLCAAIPGVSVAAEKAQLQQKSEELARVKARIKQLQTQLQSAEGERQGHNSALRETEERIGDLARRIRVIAVSLDRQRQRMAELEQERADARLQLDFHRQTMEQQIRAAYIMGRQEKVKILLNQQDPAVVSRVMVYYDYLNDARLARMNLIRDSLQRLAKIEQAISEEEQRLQQLQAKEAAEREQLERTRVGRERVIAALNARLRNRGQELDQLKANEKQLSSLLANIQEALADIPMERLTHKPFSQLKGRLPWPSKGRLAASFGSPRKVGKLRWDGVLISAPEGREVKAVHYGRVAFADWLRGFGLLLIVDHGDGYMSLYGHNQSLFKETGEWVDPGEVVALVGSSGGRSTSGVYFGIRHNGAAVNPKKWCRRTKGKRISVVRSHAVNNRV